MRELRERAIDQAAIAHLELERRQDRAEVGVTAPLPVSIRGALHLIGPGADSGERVRDAASGVVMGVHADGASERPHDLADVTLDLPRERASVGVAENDRL